MILNETKLASTVLDGEEEGEETKKDETPSTEEVKASATLLDGEGDGSTNTPSEEGKDGNDSSESSGDSSESPKEGGEAN